MLENIKVYVGKHSKEIQEKFFALGCKWTTGKIEVRNLTAPFLYIDGNNYISYGENIVDFNRKSYKELTVAEILAMEVPKPKKTIRDLYPLSGFRVMEDSRIIQVNNVSPHYSYELWNTLPTKEEAEAYKILPMLLQFRDRYNKGWKPNWENFTECKYVLRCCEGKIEKDASYSVQKVFAFKTAKIRNKFLEDFKEELEIVKSLL